MTKVKLILLVLMSVWMLFATEMSYGRYAAILIDADNGNLLHEVDANQSWYPASLTKVMTLYMTFEALKSGRIQYFDAMKTSSHAASQPTSKLGLRSGEYLTVRDAVLAIITRSANDAAVVLGEHLGGSEENFAVKMTDKAHSLGMYNTRFMNATGLPNDWQVTTSRDMAVLAWNIQRHFPEYYQNFSAYSFNFKGRELRNINKFTAKYPGAEGMKTGFTCGSGYNLIASAHQNGKRLIGVVLGGMTSAERYQLMYSMMDAGFENRYGSGIGKHINTMPTSLTGPPPYQLGCGSKGHLHSASLVRHISPHHIKSRHRYISKSKIFVAHPHFVKSRPALKTVKTYNAPHKVKLSKHPIIKKSVSTAHKKIVTHSKRPLQGKRTRYHHSSAR